MASTSPLSRLNAALSGRYRLERELGQGGMATVYLAEDLKHHRNVALKVLKPELAAVVGAERFLAEIRTTASLQHPHILPLHDSGEADGLLFYVMPYVEGESLRERLDREHQLPVEEAVRIATNVAEALDYAHRRGVIHRDIKPANILLQDGKPVVSDFGIALAVSAEGGGRLTETGLSLGTPHYMSPEQATGDLSVGPPTDIYALGCVLYEMLVGEPPYTGSTPQAVLGKIITGEVPSAAAERKTVPANVDAAIARALEKMPADRFGSAAELGRALADPRFGPVQTQREGRSLSSLWNPLSAGASAAALGLAGVLAWSGGPWARQDIASPGRLAARVMPPPGVEVGGGAGLDLSPDGRTIVFVGREEGRPARLFRRDLGSLDAHPISGTENPWMPFFSPDGEWVGFFNSADNTLKKVRLDGSELQTLASAPPVRTGGWSSEGEIIFSSTGLSGLSRVSATGGEAAPILREVGAVSWMDLLPGGEAVLTSKLDETSNEWRLFVVPLDGREPKTLVAGSSPRFVETGHLLYVREGSLWAVPFDAGELEIVGDPRRIMDDVQVVNRFGVFAVSPDRLVLMTGDVSAVNTGTPHWVDRSGDRQPLGIEPGRYAWPRISPDGGRVALARVESDNWDIVVFDASTRVTTRLTFDSAADYAPVWTPDGEHIVFSSDRDGEPSLYRRRSDGSADVERLTTASDAQTPHDVLADGSVLFTQSGTSGGEVWLLGSDGVPSPLLPAAGGVADVALSPFGDFIAYQSDLDGYPEIYVRGFRRTGGPWMVSTLDVGGSPGQIVADPRVGEHPRWSRDGREVLYRAGAALVSVPVTRATGFSVGVPSVLFETGWPAAAGAHYDAAPDGSRFVVIEISDSGRELVVIQDWARALSSQRAN